MHIMKSAAYLVIAGALAVGTATEASAQQIPRGGKDAPPVVPDTVIVTRRDTVTVFRRDTLTVTRWDTVTVDRTPPVIYPKSFYWGPEVGGTIPFRNLSRGQGAAWHVGLVAGWHPAQSSLGFQVEGVYHRISEISAAAGLTGDASLMNVNANLKIGTPLFSNFLGSSRMYVVAGPSFFYSKNLRWSEKDAPNDFFVDDERCTLASCPQEDTFNADFGWNAGLGLQVANRVTVESKFHHMLGEGSRFFITPITFALTF